MKRFFRFIVLISVMLIAFQSISAYAINNNFMLSIKSWQDWVGGFFEDEEMYSCKWKYLGEVSGGVAYILTLHNDIYAYQFDVAFMWDDVNKVREVVAFCEINDELWNDEAYSDCVMVLVGIWQQAIYSKYNDKILKKNIEDCFYRIYDYLDLRDYDKEFNANGDLGEFYLSHLASSDSNNKVLIRVTFYNDI